MEQKKKIGIMGGTFNPIHYGHLLLAEEAWEFFKLDEVLFIPSGNSYMKDASEILDGEKRLEMTALAIEDNPHFRLSAMEVERGGRTYTWETLLELKKTHPGQHYYFILGADSLLSLESWKKPEEIIKNCTIIAAVRGNRSEAEIKEKAAFLTESCQADIRLLPARYRNLSSSEIRNRLKDGLSVKYMLPDRVLDYIGKNHLYSVNRKVF